MAQKLELNTTVVAAPDQISSEVGDEAVILGLSRGRYYGLNEVGLFIWRRVQSPTRLSDISDEIVTAYDVERPRAEADVLDLVGKLLAEGLVELQMDS